MSLVDIFEPLSTGEIEEVYRRHPDVTLKRGEVFFTPADSCEMLFILQEGRVRIYTRTPEGREFTLAVLESGTMFGEMSLAGQTLREVYAEAMESARVASVSRDDLERLVLDKPQVGLQLIRLLAERLTAYETRMRDLALKEVPARLASFILLLVETEGVKTCAGFKIPTRYTHYHLGTMIGANREAVTRAFVTLRNAGAITTRHRRIHIEDPPALKRAAEHGPPPTDTEAEKPHPGNTGSTNARKTEILENVSWDTKPR